MSVTLRWSRSSLAGAICILAPIRAAAQARSDRHFEVTLQASYIPLYEGDATVGSYAGIGPTLRLAYRPGAGTVRPLVEGFYTTTLSSDFNDKPRIASLGLVLGSSVGGRGSAVQGVVGVGLGYLRVDAKEYDNCQPPLCFREGGGNFHDAQLTTFVGDIGVVLSANHRVGFRIDARMHAPIGAAASIGDSGDSRHELAAGVTLRW